MTKETLIEVLGALAIAYPTAKQQNKSERARAFMERYGDVPDMIITAAIRQHISTSKFYPTFSELDKLVRRPHLTAIEAPKRETRENIEERRLRAELIEEIMTDCGYTPSAAHQCTWYGLEDHQGIEGGTKWNK